MTHCESVALAIFPVLQAIFSIILVRIQSSRHHKCQPFIQIRKHGLKIYHSKSETIVKYMHLMPIYRLVICTPCAVYEQSSLEFPRVDCHMAIQCLSLDVI